MPPRPSPSLRLGLVLLAAAVSPALRLSAQTPAAPAPATPAPAPPAAPGKAPSTYERLIALWADVPAYHDRLTSTAPGPRKPAQLISAFSPAPPFPLPEGTTIRVNVALVIGDTGKVEAARILDSTDARFNQTALDGVKQWLFRPALGDEGPRLSFTVAPINFQGAPEPAPRHLPVQFAGFTRGHIGDTNTLTGRFLVRDDDPRHPIRAGRVVITRAQDDTGQVLSFNPPGNFYVTAVGGGPAEDYVRNPTPPFDFELSKYAPAATKVTTLEGALELALPAYDPNATVAVDKVISTLGSPLRSAALRAQNVTIVLYDKPTSDSFAKINAAGGLADFVGPPPAIAMPPEMADHINPAKQMQEGDIAVTIEDPNDRLIGLEFQTAIGQPLHYDHKGRYHLSGIGPGKRVDIYAVQLPADAKLVCWLITDKSLLKVPFQIHDLPLPPRKDS